MRVILAMVMSADGRTTKGMNSNIYDWTSTEDRDYFFSLIEKNNAIIMSRKTYEAAKDVIKLSPTKLRLVVTSQPAQYTDQQVLNQLEFTDETPTKIVNNLKEKSYDQVLLVGGSELNGSFFKAGLINELWLTIEPIMFGEGSGLAGVTPLNTELELLSVEKLNSTGTLLVKYKVL